MISIGLVSLGWAGKEMLALYFLPTPRSTASPGDILLAIRAYDKSEVLNKKKKEIYVLRIQLKFTSSMHWKALSDHHKEMHNQK